MPSCKLAVYQMPGQIVWRDGAYRVGDIAICSSSDDADARSLPGDWYWTADDGHMPVGPFPDRDSALAHGMRACLAYGETELVDSVSKLASYVGPDEKGASSTIAGAGSGPVTASTSIYGTAGLASGTARSIGQRAAPTPAMAGGLRASPAMGSGERKMNYAPRPLVWESSHSRRFRSDSLSARTRDHACKPADSCWFSEE